MNAKKRPRPVPKTFCRILGEEKGPDGKTYEILEPITDPDEQRSARERYVAAMTRLMRKRQEGQRVTQSKSTSGGVS